MSKQLEELYNAFFNYFSQPEISTKDEYLNKAFGVYNDNDFIHRKTFDCLLIPAEQESSIKKQIEVMKDENMPAMSIDLKEGIKRVSFMTEDSKIIITTAIINKLSKQNQYSSDILAIKPSELTTSHIFNITEDGQATAMFVTTDKHNNQKAVPLRLKNLPSFMFEDENIRKSLEKIYGYALKDLFAEADKYDNPKQALASVNLSLNEINKAKSIKELKENRWARIAQLNVNKGKLDVFQLNAIKNLRPILTWEYTDRIIQRLLSKELVLTSDAFINSENFFKQILSSQIKNYEFEYNWKHYVNDTYRLAKNLKHRLDYKGSSFKSLENLHNDLSVEQQQLGYKKRYKGISKFKVNSKFEDLIKALPENFEVIDTPKELFYEGAVMHHCVAGYGDSINAGHCLITRATILGERVTIEWRRDKNNGPFRYQQIQKVYNSRPKKEVFEHVNKLIAELHQHLEINTDEKETNEKETNDYNDYFEMPF